MGLLERALKYKQQLNDKGRETLIDRIKGPAESRFIESNNSEVINTKDFDSSDLSEETDLNAEPEIFSAEVEQTTSALEKTEQISIPSDTVKDDETYSDERTFDEEIILIDDKLNEQTVNNKTSSDIEEINSITTKPVKNIEKHDEIEKNQLTDEIEIQKSYPDEKTSDGTVDEEYKMPEFNDYAVLYEILKEFIQSESVDEIYSAILFSVMGQLGVSSASILAPSESDPDKWVITQSNGIKIPESELAWDVSHGILEILKKFQGVIDVEDIKEDVSLREDYYRFISADARLIVPVIHSGELAGVIMVGEKLDSENFSPSEIEFLSSLSETASSAIKAISTYEKANTELLGLRIEKEILFDVEIMQQTLLSAGSIHELEDIIRKNFYSLGIESYTIFLEEPVTGDFYPAYFEMDDNLGWQGSGFRIKRENRLISFLLNKKTSIMLDNFMESNVMIETFGLSRIEKMSVFISYPLIISGKLTGFIALYKINPAVETIDVDIRLQRIVRFIFPYIYHFMAIDPEKNRCEDLTESFYSRIEREIKKASDMNIPLSFISLSVKNYKRFYDRFGRIEMNKLFDSISEIIKERIYSGEFSARLDLNRFIIVLPGKDKKYSATLSGIIKNEVANKFNTTDFRILMTFISAVFPEDGKDLFSILEILD